MPRVILRAAQEGGVLTLSDETEEIYKVLEGEDKAAVEGLLLAEGKVELFFRADVSLVGMTILLIELVDSFSSDPLASSS